MMTAAFATLGIDAVYLAIDVTPEHVRDAVQGLVQLGAVGANVTVPHKRAALRCCDELDSSAAAIGAVNTLSFERGRVIGHNTDAGGAVDALRSAGVDLAGKRVAVLGNGGAARAVAIGLTDAGTAHIAICARRDDDVLAAALRARGATCDSVRLDDAHDAIANADVIVQATSAGFGDAIDDDRIIAPLQAARHGTWTMDLVYSPRETRWLRAARQLGLRPIDGLGMLASQAARALSIWFHVDVQPDILRGFLDAPDPHG